MLAHIKKIIVHYIANRDYVPEFVASDIFEHIIETIIDMRNGESCYKTTAEIISDYRLPKRFKYPMIIYSLFG